MDSSIKLQNNKLYYKVKVIDSYNRLIENLNYYNDYFSITLSDLTGNLEEYAQKLYERAINLEIVNENNERQGMISFYANDFVSNIAFLTLIVVDKRASNKGIGSMLIDYVENYCKDHGMKEIKLEVLKDNENAIRFYKKHNYVFCEERDKTYYMKKKINLGA